MRPHEKTQDLSHADAIAECSLPICRYVQPSAIRVLLPKLLQPGGVSKERFQLDRQSCIDTIC